MPRSVVAVLAGLLVVGGLLLAGMWWTRPNRLELRGEVLRVRTQQLDPGNTLAVIDLRVENPSRTQFVVRNVAVAMERGDGTEAEAEVFSDVDAARLFEYYKTLGPKFNPSLMIRDKVEPGERIDRMLAVRVPGGEDQIASRRGFRFRVTDVDGAVRQIAERRLAPSE